MTPVNEPSSPNDDLDRWLDEMAGRRPHSSQATLALRDVVARHAELNAERLLGAAAEPDAQQRASARLRAELEAITLGESKVQAAAREPTLDVPAAVRAPDTRAANDRRWRLVAGLGVLMVAAGLLWQLQPADDGGFVVAVGEAPVWRELGDPLTVSVSNPLQAAQALAKQVAPFDTRPVLYRQGESIVVDFDTQLGRIDETASKVADLHIRANVRPGSNRVVFSKAP